MVIVFIVQTILFTKIRKSRNLWDTTKNCWFRKHDLSLRQMPDVLLSICDHCILEIRINSVFSFIAKQWRWNAHCIFDFDFIESLNAFSFCKRYTLIYWMLIQRNMWFMFICHSIKACNVYSSLKKNRLLLHTCYILILYWMSSGSATVSYKSHQFFSWHSFLSFCWFLGCCRVIKNDISGSTRLHFTSSRTTEFSC